jgi:hypothetical protein
MVLLEDENDGENEDEDELIQAIKSKVHAPDARPSRTAAVPQRRLLPLHAVTGYFPVSQCVDGLLMQCMSFKRSTSGCLYDFLSSVTTRQPFVDGCITEG